MPSSQAILEQLGTIANHWGSIAAAWHVVFGGVFIATAAGWRPSHRLLAAVLASALASVSALAWGAANPFNGAVFAILAVALTALVRTLPPGPIRLSSWPMVSVWGSARTVCFGLSRIFRRRSPGFACFSLRPWDWSLAPRFPCSSPSP